MLPVTATPSSCCRKSRWNHPRRNSPSVMLRMPRLSIFDTAAAIAWSSTSRSCAALISPAAHCDRASTTSAGRSRLPTWSARKGGSIGLIIVLGVWLGRLRLFLRDPGDTSPVCVAPYTVGEYRTCVRMAIAHVEPKENHGHANVRHLRPHRGHPWHIHTTTAQRPVGPDQDGRRSGLRRFPPGRASRVGPLHGTEPGGVHRRGITDHEEHPPRTDGEVAPAAPSGAHH